MANHIKLVLLLFLVTRLQGTECRGNEPTVNISCPAAVHEEEDAEIVCEVDANPDIDPMVHWFHNGELLSSETSLSLTIVNVSREDRGFYTCQVSNEVGHSNNTCFLDVYYGPFGCPDLLPRFGIARVANDYTLECNVQHMDYGNPHGVFIWRKDVSELVIHDKKIYLTTELVTDSGEYACSLRNVYGESSESTATLIVEAPVVIEDDIGFMGYRPSILEDDFTFNYTVSGSNIHSHILLNGSSMVEDTAFKVKNEKISGNFSYGQETALVLSWTWQKSGLQYERCDDVRYFDGNYTLTVSGEAANVTSVAETKFAIETQFPPISKNNTIIDAKLGEVKAIECPFCANPRPHNITWDFNGESIPAGATISGRWIRFDEIKLHHFGNYSCRVSNQINDVEYTEFITIILTENGPPHPVKKLQVLSSTPETVLLYWENGGNGGYEMSGHDIEFKTIGETYWNNRSSKSCVGEGKFCRYRLTGLKNGKSYKIRVRSVNNNPDTSYSEFRETTANTTESKTLAQFEGQPAIIPCGHDIPESGMLEFYNCKWIKGEEKPLHALLVRWFYPESKGYVNDTFRYDPISGDLIVESTSLDDETHYTCRSDNTTNEVFTYQFLEVLVPPEGISIEGEGGTSEITAIEGQTTNFWCTLKRVKPKDATILITLEPSGKMIDIADTIFRMNSDGSYQVVNNVTQVFWREDNNQRIRCEAFHEADAKYNAFNETDLEIYYMYTTIVEEKDPDEIPNLFGNKTLVCVVKRPGLPTSDHYLWYKDGDLLEDKEIDEDLGSKYLHLIELDFDNEGEYTCSRNNSVGEGTSENSYTLKIILRPSGAPVVIPSQAVMNVEKNLTLFCNISTLDDPGRPPASIYSWKIDGELVENEENERMTYSPSVIADCVLISCKVRNSRFSSNESDPSYITVEAPVMIEWQNASNFFEPMVDDSNFTITYIVSGTNVTDYIIRNDTDVLGDDSFMYAVEKINGTFAYDQTTAEVITWNWQLDNKPLDTCQKVSHFNGNYTFEAMGFVGETTSVVHSSFTIEVLYCPVKNMNGWNESSNIGTFKILTCNACANPNPESYEWTFEGKNLTQGSIAIGKRVLIPEVKPHHFGTYTCIVTNIISGKKCRKTFFKEFVMTGPPDPVEDLRMVSSTSETAFLSWITGWDGGYELLGHEIEVYLDGDRVHHQNLSEDCRYPHTLCRYRAQGLVASANFSARVRTVNANPTTPYSVFRETNIKTKGRPVVHLYKVSINTYALKVYWKYQPGTAFLRSSPEVFVLVKYKESSEPEYKVHPKDGKISASDQVTIIVGEFSSYSFYSIILLVYEGDLQSPTFQVPHEASPFEGFPSWALLILLVVVLPVLVLFLGLIYMKKRRKYIHSKQDRESGILQEEVIPLGLLGPLKGPSTSRTSTSDGQPNSSGGLPSSVGPTISRTPPSDGQPNSSGEPPSSAVLPTGTERPNTDDITEGPSTSRTSTSDGQPNSSGGPPSSVGPTISRTPPSDGQPNSSGEPPSSAVLPTGTERPNTDDITEGPSTSRTSTSDGQPNSSGGPPSSVGPTISRTPPSDGQPNSSGEPPSSAVLPTGTERPNTDDITEGPSTSRTSTSDGQPNSSGGPPSSVDPSISRTSTSDGQPNSSRGPPSSVGPTISRTPPSDGQPNSSGEPPSSAVLPTGTERPNTDDITEGPSTSRTSTSDGQPNSSGGPPSSVGPTISRTPPSDGQPNSSGEPPSSAVLPTGTERPNTDDITEGPSTSRTSTSDGQPNSSGGPPSSVGPSTSRTSTSDGQPNSSGEPPSSVVLPADNERPNADDICEDSLYEDAAIENYLDNVSSRQPPPPIPELADLLLPDDVKLKKDVMSCTIDVSNFEFVRKIGEGHFSEVGLYTWKKSDGTHENVAVKTILGDMAQDEEKFKEFLTEGILTHSLDNPHVLTAYGVGLHHGLVQIILPYMANGNLCQLLRNGEDFDKAVLTGFCLDATKGLCYMEERNLVHRDVAARNFMVDDGLSIKLADMGTVKEVPHTSYYKPASMKGLPIRWMAPECLRSHRFSVKSDVWAFGITMWEIFNKGKKPYGAYLNRQIKQAVLDSQKHPDQDDCPHIVYQLMKNCWAMNQDDRPSFSTLVRQLEDIKEDMLNDEDEYDAVWDDYTSDFDEFDDLELEKDDFPMKPIFDHPNLRNIGEDLKMAISKHCDIIDIEELSHVKILGEGHFCDLSLQRWTNNGEEIELAVKRFKAGPDTTESAMGDFLLKGYYHAIFEHQNIMKVYGFAFTEGCPYILQQYMEKGEFTDLLRIQDFSAKELINFCLDISKGMRYLAEKKHVLRHLAISSVMVTADKRACISDLSGLIYGNDEDYNTAMEERKRSWFEAPEVISHRKYSPQTDVWCFGITMLETFGRGPLQYQYEGYVEAVKNENFWEVPDGCPGSIAIMISMCLKVQSDRRPPFLKIVRGLEKVLIDQDCEDVEVDEEPTNTHEQNITISSEKLLLKTDENLEGFIDDEELLEKVMKFKIDMRTWQQNGTLGAGRYGIVYQYTGTTAGVQKKFAVKSLADDTNMAEFFWDAVLSVELRPNPYVVTALGVSIFEDRVHTIFPFKEHGDLHSILVNKREDLNMQQLLQFCYDAAQGMQHIEEQGYVHRNLTARSILVDKDMKACIAEFGMACTKMEVAVSIENPPNLRWYSPEGHTGGKLTSKSDVWSFGATMWEIFSSGREPFSEIPLTKVKRHVLAKNVLSKPTTPQLPDELYTMILNCTKFEEADRPRFSEVVEKLASIVLYETDDHLQEDVYDKMLIRKLSEDLQDQLQPVLLNMEEFIHQRRLDKGKLGYTHEYIWKRTSQSQNGAGRTMTGKFGYINDHSGRKNLWSERVAVKTMAVVHAVKKHTVELYLRSGILATEFYHPNLLHAYGVAVYQGQYHIILPFMDLGNLQDILQKKDSDIKFTQTELLIIGLEAAQGMDYLAQKDVIHSRLRAKNILLTCMTNTFESTEGIYPKVRYTAKIGEPYLRDGKSRMSTKSILWMAPECLDGQPFTLMSDVWSFGVTLWETFSHGKVPYADWEPSPMSFKRRLLDGERLPKDDDCPEIIHDLIQQCFQIIPDYRPTMKDIASHLQGLGKESVEAEAGYVGSEDGHVPEEQRFLQSIDRTLRQRLNSCIIPMNELSSPERLGSGRFGDLFLYDWKKGSEPIKVFAKSLSANNFWSVQDFLYEAVLSGQLQHDNVLASYGVCVDGLKVLNILPYMENGNLQDYVYMSDRLYDPKFVQVLLRICVDVANAMEYIGEKNFLHRNLCAKNVLLNEELQAFVADFSMAKKKSVEQTLPPPLPVRWMCPEWHESGEFTTKSDVWSFGVTMWEAFSPGKEPFDDLQESGIKNHLLEGFYLLKPDSCPDEVYKIMKNCFQRSPEERPDFQTLRKRMFNIMDRKNFKNTKSSPKTGEAMIDELPGNLFVRVKRAMVDTSSLKYLQNLGHGSFGEVDKYSGDIHKMGKTENYAVKTLKGINRYDVAPFYWEGVLAIGLDHPNILSPLGVGVIGDIPVIILPFMEQGDLHQLLLKRELKVEELVDFSLGIAKGMEYISNHKYIHRDLAARNVLVNHCNHVKIADFGLACDMLDGKVYYAVTKPLPTRWLAPESVAFRRFTLQSDVWSFGVTMWEIFNKGQLPYPKFIDGIRLEEHIKKGCHPENTPHCPVEIDGVMRQCFNKDAEKRPCFSTIVRRLQDIKGRYESSLLHPS